jgi:hypothetical protein
MATPLCFCSYSWLWAWGGGRSYRKGYYRFFQKEVLNLARVSQKGVVRIFMTPARVRWLGVVSAGEQQQGRRSQG